LRGLEQNQAGEGSTLACGVTNAPVAGNVTTTSGSPGGPSKPRNVPTSPGRTHAVASRPLPFGFTGVLKIDLETGDAILEPQHSLEGNVEDACAALTA
jgi:hypothetical protein